MVRRSLLGDYDPRCWCSVGRDLGPVRRRAQVLGELLVDPAELDWVAIRCAHHLENPRLDLFGDCERGIAQTASSGWQIGCGGFIDGVHSVNAGVFTIEFEATYQL